jgi:hypothetical protein
MLILHRKEKGEESSSLLEENKKKDSNKNKSWFLKKNIFYCIGLQQGPP